MKIPYISIVIPTFNSAKSIEPCLESILCQTYKDFEIIIVDGISTDSTVEIIKDFAGRYQYISWISEPDNGVYDAMNKGMKRAKGKWIYFLGSDDKLASPNVFQQISMLTNQSVKVIYGNVKIVGDTSWAKDGDIYDGKFDFPKLSVKNICHQAIFYNLKFVRKKIGLYNIQYSFCADWDFNLRCWSQSPFTYIDIVIAHFSGGGITTVSNYDKAFYNDREKKIKEYFGEKTLKNKITQWFHFIYKKKPFFKSKI